MIALEVNQQDKKVFDDLAGKNIENVKILTVKRFDGTSDLIEAIVPLTISALPFITKIILEQIRSKKHVKIKHKGMEIRGISESNVVSIVEELMKKNNDKNK